jgi:hypothetical protein
MPLAAGVLAVLALFSTPASAGVLQRPECPISWMQPIPIRVARRIALCVWGGAPLRSAAGAVIGEIGDVAAGDRARPILLPTPLANPVVIVGAPTAHEEEPGLGRALGVSPAGFRLRFQEWPHLDGEHEPETLAFLALAAGRHSMPDGSVWEVGHFDLRGTERWQPRAFMDAFAAPPALFLSLQTENEPDLAVARARGVGALGFEAALFEARQSDGAHVTERVGYLAIGSPARSGRLGPEPALTWMLRRVETDEHHTPVASQLLWLEEDATPEADNSHGAEAVDVLLVGSRVFAQEVSAREPDAVSVRRTAPEHAARVEWGVVDGLDHNWTTVPLAKHYKNPVVVVRPTTALGADPAVARIRNAVPGSFELRVQEWSYLDGLHRVPEQAFYLVAEAGVHALAGLVVEAGHENTALVARSGFEDVALPAALPDVPAVFAAVMTENDPAPVTVRLDARTPAGFRLALQEEEQTSDGHGMETVGWIAVQRGRGVTEQDRVLRVFDAQVDHNLTAVDFGEALGQRFPFLVGGIASFRGTDPAELRLFAVGTTGAVLFVQEEQSHDAETNHALEDVSIFAAE